MRSRLLPVLAILAAVLIFFSYTKLVYESSVADHRAAIESGKRALAAAADYRQRANDLIAARDSMDPVALAQLETMLPDSVNNVRTILDLTALASRSNMVLSSIDVSEESAQQAGEEGEVTGGPTASVELSLSGKGTYSAFQKFLAGIETSQRLLDVVDLSVAGSETGIYTYQMTARLYWLR